MSLFYDCNDLTVRAGALSSAAHCVSSGQLVVLPTDTVYGIGADAFDPVAVADLLAAKGRGRDMPVPVLVGSWSTIDGLVNVVTESEDAPAAVLIRALQPLDGISTMRRRRTRATKGRRRVAASAVANEELCRGPGNLTMAMGITLAENRLDLLGRQLFIEDRGIEVGPVVWGPRIGISVGTERHWRVFVDGHPAVSGPRRA